MSDQSIVIPSPLQKWIDYIEYLNDKPLYDAAVTIVSNLIKYDMGTAIRAL